MAHRSPLLTFFLCVALSGCGSDRGSGSNDQGEAIPQNRAEFDEDAARDRAVSELGGQTSQDVGDTSRCMCGSSQCCKRNLLTFQTTIRSIVQRNLNDVHEPFYPSGDTTDQQPVTVANKGYLSKSKIRSDRMHFQSAKPCNLYQWGHRTLKTIEPA